MNRQTTEGDMKEGLGAARIREEWKLPFVVVSKQVDQPLLLRHHEYALCWVIHPAHCSSANYVPPEKKMQTIKTQREVSK